MSLFKKVCSLTSGKVPFSGWFSFRSVSSSLAQSHEVLRLLTEASSVCWSAEGRMTATAPSEVLSDVLLVLVSLLLSELADLVFQLDDGSLDLVVLTDQ